MNTDCPIDAPSVFMDSGPLGLPATSDPRLREDKDVGQTGFRNDERESLHTSLPHSAALAMAARLAFIVSRSYIAQVSSFSFRISTSQRTSP